MESSRRYDASDEANHAAVFVWASAQPESKLQRLRRENERLLAEVASLGKVQALRDLERR